MSPKWRVKNNRTRPNTSKQIKGGKHTLHNIAGGILPLASHLSLEKAIHWGMSETFGRKVAGNCFRKFGWYLKTSLHGHPMKKKKFEGVNVTVLKRCSLVNLKIGKLSFRICCLNLKKKLREQTDRKGHLLMFHAIKVDLAIRWIWVPCAFMTYFDVITTLQ